MSPKITINGKEIDTANLPRELQNIEGLSPQLKELLADKDGNGSPDIADNPFAALAKLGKLASMGKDMPVLVNLIKNQSGKQGFIKGEKEEMAILEAMALGEPISPSATSSSSSIPNRFSSPAQKLSAQYRPSTSSPIKHDTGRRILFMAVAIGLVGWYIWQSGMLPNLDF